MSNVGIFMMPEYGGLNGSFALARTLQRRGHHIRYFLSPEFEPHVARQGFGSTLYSTGQHEPVESWATKVPGLRFLKLRAQFLEHFASTFDAWVGKDALDAVLVDPVLWNVAAGALQKGLPYATLSPTYAAPFSLDYPPIHSPVVPRGAGAGARLRNLLAWGFQAWLPWGRAVHDQALACVGHDAPGRVRQAGGRLLWGDFGYRPDVPELVIGPRALDFESASARPGRSYLGTSVEPSRQDTTFDWSWYDPAKPLAYCSMGTFGHFRDVAKPFFSAVIESFRKREGWQLIVSCGGLAKTLRREDLPASIRVEKSVPQLEVLQRAQLFLMHAGIGSVREALFYGVPMLLFPITMDQPGTAARVEHHRLGLRGDIRTKDPATITALVDRLVGRADIAAAVEAMKRACQEQRELDEGADLVERMMRGARA